MHALLITRSAVVLWAVALAAPVRAQRPVAAAPAGGPLVIEHVTVVDVERGLLQADRRVVVAGTRIAAVDSGTAARPAGARRVDGRGKFLIPGLWDMHVHTFRNRMDAPGQNTDDSDVFFPAFLANGVTGVRDMSTDLADHVQIRRWADARVAGALAAPRLVGGSPLLGGVPPIQRNALSVGTAADARRVVDSLVDGGVGFLKVYSGLSREAYFAIAAQAKRRGVPFAGHVPGSVTHAEASDAGQRSFEHMNDAPRNCSADMWAADVRVAAIRRDTSVSRDSAAALARAATLALLARFDVRDCAPLLARFARNRTWQVPTLTVNRLAYARADSATHADPRLRFVSPRLLAEWEATGSLAGYGQPLSAAERAIELARYRVRERLLAAMHEAGVPILAGTDVHNPYVYPGFSLHDELALLVEAGLPPLAALRAATLDPARFLGATDSLGTVAPGKLADLVLLDADPLQDIHNTTRIRAVVLNGRYLDRAALDALLADAERVARLPEQRRPRP